MDVVRIRVEGFEGRAESRGSREDVRERSGRDEGEDGRPAGARFGRVLPQDSLRGDVREDLAQEVGAESASRDDDGARDAQRVEAFGEGEDHALVDRAQDVGAGARQAHSLP